MYTAPSYHGSFKFTVNGLNHKMLKIIREKHSGIKCRKEIFGAGLLFIPACFSVIGFTFLFFVIGLFLLYFFDKTVYF